MSLIGTIDNDYLDAYKGREEIRVSTLRLLKSALQNAKIEKKSDLGDDDIIVIVRREIKRREESLTEYERGKRSDLINQTKEEIAILSNYLPPQFSDEKIVELIKETLPEVKNIDPRQPGRLIGLVMAKTKNKADSARVIKLIQETLGKEG